MMFRIVDHTADLAIEAEGATAGECLSAAAQALACIITGRDDLHSIRPEGEVAFEVAAPDLAMLAVAFLSEVLWLLEEESTLWIGGGADVRQEVDWHARACGNAVVYDTGRHGAGTEVKAITYHHLLFGPVGGMWRLRVVVDI